MIVNKDGDLLKTKDCMAKGQVSIKYMFTPTRFAQHWQVKKRA